MMISVDGAVAFGATRWLQGNQLCFTAKTFLCSGTHAHIRIFVPGTKHTVDAEVVIDKTRSSEDWLQTICTCVLNRMPVSDRQALESWVFKNGV
jgi:hypothetical protein